MARHLLLALAFLGLLLTPPAAHAEKRSALIIGNSAYTHAPSLPNPKNDARALAERLRGMGFDVVEGIDLDKRRMEQTLAEFARRLDGVDVGLVFYAGHGLQVDGVNYLVPIDASLEHRADLPFEAIAMSIILEELERSVPMGLIFLDACRDNPLSRSLARSMGASRSTAVGNGLAEMSGSVGTLIAYATQPNNVALDGAGDHSPFTEALLDHIGTRGLEIRQVLTRVRNEVIETTDGRQVPWDHSSLTRDFYFEEAPPVAATAEAAASATEDPRAEMLFWDTIADGNDADEFEAYLSSFGEQGIFASLARDRLEEIQLAAAASALSPGAVVADGGSATLPAPAQQAASIETAKPVVTAALAPERQAQKAPAPPAAAPLAEVQAEVRARSLIERAGGIALVADKLERWGKDACSEHGTVDGWRDTAIGGSPVRLPDLVGAPLDQAAWALDHSGVEGSARAVAGTDGVALIAHVTVSRAQAVFNEPGSPGRASLCILDTVQWQSWRFISSHGGTLRSLEKTSFGGALGGLIGGMQLHVAEVALDASTPFANCLAFSGVENKRDWIGGYVCRRDRGGVTIADIADVLDQTSVDGAFND